MLKEQNNQKLVTTKILFFLYNTLEAILDFQFGMSGNLYLLESKSCKRNRFVNLLNN